MKIEIKYRDNHVVEVEADSFVEAVEAHKAKLRGHYQYYGISGNIYALRRYYAVALRLTRKWLNRRSQRGKLWRKQFAEYVKHYPLPRPAIKHNLFTLSFVK